MKKRVIHRYKECPYKRFDNGPFDSVDVPNYITTSSKRVTCKWCGKKQVERMK